MKRHIEAMHADKAEVKTYECSICNTIFKQKGNLKRHMESVHEGNDDFFQLDSFLKHVLPLNFKFWREI